MIKTSIAVLAALVAVAGISAPALAASSAQLNDNSNPQNFNKEIVFQALESRGLDVTGLYDWGNDDVRAVVQEADGSSKFLYFDAVTLQQIDPTGAGQTTRVLTKVDTGSIAAPIVSTHSLQSDYDDE